MRISVKGFFVLSPIALLEEFCRDVFEKNLKKIMENTQVKYTMINHLKTTFFILIILFNI